MSDVNSGTLIFVPRALPGNSPLKFDLGEILKAESRITDIATVTVAKAPEMMALFNVIYLNLSGMISSVQFEYELAKKRKDETRAIALIDKIPGILKEKGLTSAKSPMGSEDIRNALLDLDTDYGEAQEKVIQLKCILSLLEGKRDSIDRAYTAVKKVYGDQSQYRHTQDLSTEPQSDSGDSFFKKDY
jgi:hypothetical protein